MLVGRIFRTLGMGLVRRDCSVRCITALYRPPVCTENLSSGVVAVKSAKDGV
jgi:hypothetical protein